MKRNTQKNIQFTKKVIIDASNIAYIEKKQNKPVANNINLVMVKLERLGFDVICIIGAKLRHTVLDKKIINELLKMDNVYQTPAGIDDDLYILDFARKHNVTKIISNDRFDNYKPFYHKQIAKRVSVMIIRGLVSIPGLYK